MRWRSIRGRVTWCHRIGAIGNRRRRILAIAWLWRICDSLSLCLWRGVVRLTSMWWSTVWGLLIASLIVCHCFFLLWWLSAVKSVVDGGNARAQRCWRIAKGPLCQRWRKGKADDDAAQPMVQPQLRGAGARECKFSEKSNQGQILLRRYINKYYHCAVQPPLICRVNNNNEPTTLFWEIWPPCI